MAFIHKPARTNALDQMQPVSISALPRLMRMAHDMFANARMVLQCEMENVFVQMGNLLTTGSAVSH